jgi:hypothetical protein
MIERIGVKNPEQQEARKVSNSISSTDDALRALAKVCALGLPVRVNVSLPGMGSSFTGKIFSADESAIDIRGVNEQKEMTGVLRLYPATYEFRGIFDDLGPLTSANILIVKRGTFNDWSTTRIEICTNFGEVEAPLVVN